jgi:hypothetical protein
MHGRTWLANSLTSSSYFSSLSQAMILQPARLISLYASWSSRNLS